MLSITASRQTMGRPGRSLREAPAMNLKTQNLSLHHLLRCAGRFHSLMPSAWIWCPSKNLTAASRLGLMDWKVILWWSPEKERSTTCPASSPPHPRMRSFHFCSSKINLSWRASSSCLAPPQSGASSGCSTCPTTRPSMSAPHWMDGTATSTCWLSTHQVLAMERQTASPSSSP